MGWDFSEVNDEFIGLNVDRFQLRASLIGWCEEEGEDDTVGEDEPGEVKTMATEPLSAPAPVVGQYSSPT